MTHSPLAGGQGTGIHSPAGSGYSEGMSGATSHPASPEPPAIGATSRPFGWVIAGTVFGAGIAHGCAEKAPILTMKWLTRHQTALAIAERSISFVFAGCVIGALLGWWAELRLGRKIALTGAVAYFFLFYLIASTALNIAQTLFGWNLSS